MTDASPPLFYPCSVSQKGVVRFLLIYGLIVVGAVVIRVDRFPLTWVPMYSVYKLKSESETFSVHHKDKKQAYKGFRATHADGAQSWVSREDLNIPGRNMWRLYYQRAFGRPPPKYTHANANLDRLSRWVRGLAKGETNLKTNWRRRLITLVNRTLGHAPGDPRFIVRLEAQRDTNIFDRESFEVVKVRSRTAVIKWKTAWEERW